MEFNKGETVKFSRNQGNMLSSGGSRGGVRGPHPTTPYFWSLMERKAGRASNVLPPLLSSRSTNEKLEVIIIIIM